MSQDKVSDILADTICMRCQESGCVCEEFKQALSQLEALNKIDEGERSMAIDAIEDAIANRDIAGQPDDRGLVFAKALIQRRSEWIGELTTGQK